MLSSFPLGTHEHLMINTCLWTYLSERKAIRGRRRSEGEKSLVAAAVSNVKATPHQPVTVKNEIKQILKFSLIKSRSKKLSYTHHTVFFSGNVSFSTFSKSQTVE